jgi:hypothetical protein
LILYQIINCLGLHSYFYGLELDDDLYVELRENIGTREEFFIGINFLTTMFNFKSFNKMECPQ